jgi:hypothetical protein
VLVELIGLEVNALAAPLLVGVLPPANDGPVPAPVLGEAGPPAT